MVLGKWWCNTARPGHQSEPRLKKELERLDLRQRPTENRSGVDEGRRRSEGEDGGHSLWALRDQTHAGGGDHAQRPLAATEQGPEVVAGVVFHQAAHVGDDLARAEHRLEPDELCPRGTVAEHLEASCVRGDGAAHGRTVTAGEIDAVLPTGSFCRRLDDRHGRPGSGGELAT